MANFASTKFLKSLNLYVAILLSQSNRWLHYGAGDITTFDIFSGVRQACVLSSWLVCAAFELAMSDWRLANPQGGMDLGRYASFA